MDLTTALTDVGYKPRKTTQPTIGSLIAEMGKHNREMFAIPPPKIIVTKAGGYYRARFDGGKMFCFGENPAQARKRLEFWEGWKDHV
jgi:hypothetical protein